MVSPLLTTDDVVMFRVVASRWNVGNRCGEMGESHLLLLHNEPFDKHWRYDMNGIKTLKTHTILKKNEPTFGSFRKWKLHGLEEAASSSGEKQWKHPPWGGRGNVLDWLPKIADEKIRQACNTREHLESVDDNETVSSGSMPPDLGDMWR